MAGDAFDSTRLDLEGTRRERFVRWARANPPPEDGCGATDGRRFAAAMAAMAATSE